MQDERAFLRHTLATLAYRGGKATRGAQSDFGEFKISPGTRTVLKQTPSKWLIPTKIEIFTQNGPTQTYKPKIGRAHV